MMRTSDSILNQDLKTYFKYHKRIIFNRLLDKSNKNPFPQGKNPPYRYYNKLNELFCVFKKPLYTKVLCNPNYISKTTTIKRLLDDRALTVQTGVKFDDFLIYSVKDPKLCHHFQRICDCYYAAYECMEFVKRSGHDDLVIKCNPQYVYYMRKVFDRFNLNRRCIETDHKSHKPHMIIVMDGDDIVWFS